MSARSQSMEEPRGGWNAGKVLKKEKMKSGWK